MYRYGIWFRYKENENMDGKNYIICARNMENTLTGNPQEISGYKNRFYFLTEEKITSKQLADIIAYRWHEIITANTVGSYNGFKYNTLRPDSFELEVLEKNLNESLPYEKQWYDNFPFIKGMFNNILLEAQYIFSRTDFKTVQQALNYKFIQDAEV